MSSKKEDRLDRLERIVTDYIEESQADRKEIRQEIKILSSCLMQLTNLQLQYHRDALNPVPAPSGGD